MTPEELSDLVYRRTGRTPDRVRTQALLVIGEWDDGQKGVWRIEDLAGTPWGVL